MNFNHLFKSILMTCFITLSSFAQIIIDQRTYEDRPDGQPYRINLFQDENGKIKEIHSTDFKMMDFEPKMSESEEKTYKPRWPKWSKKNKWENMEFINSCFIKYKNELWTISPKDHSLVKVQKLFGSIQLNPTTGCFAMAQDRTVWVNAENGSFFNVTFAALKNAALPEDLNPALNGQRYVDLVQYGDEIFRLRSGAIIHQFNGPLESGGYVSGKMKVITSCIVLEDNKTLYTLSPKSLKLIQVDDKLQSSKTKLDSATDCFITKGNYQYWINPLSGESIAIKKLK